jgi:hypothetical protein
MNINYIKSKINRQIGEEFPCWTLKSVSIYNILEPTMKVTFFNSSFQNDPTVISFYSIGHSKLTVVSIVASIVISKFLHYTILATISVKSFFQQNFNLIWTRIQSGLGILVVVGCFFSL